MENGKSSLPPVVSDPLSVEIVGREILLVGASSAEPSFTADAARETGRRLTEAADRLQAK